MYCDVVNVQPRLNFSDEIIILNICVCVCVFSVCVDERKLYSRLLSHQRNLNVAEHSPHHSTQYHIFYILKLKEQLLKNKKLHNKQTSTLCNLHAHTHSHIHCSDV